MNQVALLIPAYKPSADLIQVIDSVRNYNWLTIIVIDDGSGDEFQSIFDRASAFKNCTIYRHATNLGKGRAIKSGINFCLSQFPDLKGIVTADADGQHSATDIFKVAEHLTHHDDQLVLGSRCFSGHVPARSKLGNSITSGIFKFLVGLKINDTQTGLRGFDRSILKSLMTIAGERYEYETNMLLECKTNQWHLHEVPIQTIYIENNKSSHFNPLKDSMRIYFLIIRFLASSIFSSSLDFIIYAFFIKSDFTLLQSVLFARFLSGWVNFYLNRNIVFRSHLSFSVALIRYWSLVLVMGLFSFTLMQNILKSFHYPLAAKIIVESILFIASFSIQKEFVFAKRLEKKNGK